VKLERMMQTIGMNLQRGALARGNYLKKKQVFAQMGEYVRFQPRMVPLYPQLIKFHSNIMVGAGVRFITHDAAHTVLNRMQIGSFSEKVGCIEVMDNVFIGADTTILANVRIGANVIIGANSLVNKDCEPNGVYAGIPARRIGTFDDFVAGRLKADFPTVARNQRITQEEIDFAWRAFEEKR